jgi:hypothetical protein
MVAFVNMLDRLLVLAAAARRRTIRGNVQTKIPHFRIMRRAEDAAVRGKSREDQRCRAEIFQQDFERRLKEGRSIGSSTK